MDKDRSIFEKYFPEASVEYCFQLWKKYAFHFKITPPRKSVYGNYRFLHGRHHITVNGNLKSEAFLVTYIHEVAHLSAFEKYGRRIRPHGEHWQSEFRSLMQPVLSLEVFQYDVLQALKRHLANPSSTSCVDEELHSLLQKGQHHPAHLEYGVAVASLEPNQQFLYEGRTFQMLRKMRKRFLCTELNSGKNYLFQPVAQVLPLSLSDNLPKVQSRFLVDHLEVGTSFSISGKRYELVQRRRTKALCKEFETNKLYLVPLLYQVD